MGFGAAEECLVDRVLIWAIDYLGSGSRYSMFGLVYKIDHMIYATCILHHPVIYVN